MYQLMTGLMLLIWKPAVLSLKSLLHYIIFHSASLPCYLKWSVIQTLPLLLHGTPEFTYTGKVILNHFITSKHSQRWPFAQHWKYLSSLQYYPINVLFFPFKFSSSSCMKDFSNLVLYIRVGYKIAGQPMTMVSQCRVHSPALASQFILYLAIHTTIWKLLKGSEYM